MSLNNYQKLNQFTNEYNITLDKDYEKFYNLYEEFLNCDNKSQQFLDDFIKKDQDGNLLIFIGVYYKYIEKDYDLTKKYYLMAIEQGNGSAMNSLGLYYYEIEKDYNLTKKYLLMAIEQCNSDAMNNLGHYYKHIEKDYDLMKKYFLMAIEQCDSKAMNNLGHYYKYIEKDYDLMKKYYLMSIEKGHGDAMNNLGFYYYEIEKDYELMKKYYLMAIEQCNSDTMNNLISIIKDFNTNELIILLKYYIRNKDLENFNGLYKDYLYKIEYTQEFLEFLLEIPEEFLNNTLKIMVNLYKSKVELIDLHFKYAPTAEGYTQAKQDFFNNL